MSITTPNHDAGQKLRGRWQLDPQRSSVGFRARKFWGLVTVKGHFDAYEGQLDLNADAAVELTIDAASLQTGIRKRDQHLRSADFLDAENHPEVRFVSESAHLSDDTLRVRGYLSARGRSIPLEFDAHIRGINGELEIEATTTAAHRELGMTWSPLGMIPPSSYLSVKGRLVPSERPPRHALERAEADARPGPVGEVVGEIETQLGDWVAPGRLIET
jgi:polyisoprenoid-binding protein YceI